MTTFRPLFWGVDHRADPPILSVLIVGKPHRIVTFEIQRHATPYDTEIAAIAELDAMDRELLELIGERATVATVAPIDPAIAGAAIRPLRQEPRYSGVIYCPACCHPLGRGDSPAIGYLSRCSCCQRGLSIRFAGGGFSVELSTFRR